jgi:hypothetical protein
MVVVNHKNKQTDKNERRGDTWKRRSKGLWILVFLLIIGGGAIVLSGWMRTPLSTDDQGISGTFTVREDDLVITVTESGNIKAQESTDVICEVEGRGVEIASIIPEGTVITPEDVANGKSSSLNAPSFRTVTTTRR